MAKEKKKKPAEKLVTRQRVQAALMLALGLLILNQTIQFYRMKDEIAFLDSLQESNSEVIQDINKSKEYLSSFGEDLNGIRQFLLLPTKNYDFGEGDQAVMLSEEEEEDLTTQLFTYVEKLGTYEKNQERYEANLATVQTSLKEAYWKEKADIYVKGVGHGREQALRGLIAQGITIGRIIDTTPVPHNGCRQPRTRRV